MNKKRNNMLSSVILFKFFALFHENSQGVRQGGPLKLLFSSLLVVA